MRCRGSSPDGGGSTRARGRQGRVLDHDRSALRTRRDRRHLDGSAGCARAAPRSGARRSDATDPSTEITAGATTRTRSDRPPPSRRMAVIAPAVDPASTDTRPSACAAAEPGGEEGRHRARIRRRGCGHRTRTRSAPATARRPAQPADVVGLDAARPGSAPARRERPQRVGARSRDRRPTTRSTVAPHAIGQAAAPSRPRPRRPRRTRRGGRRCATSPVSGSISGRRSTHGTQTAMARSAPAEDDAVAALGVRPGDRALGVADEVAGAALEALLVVEEDAAVGRRHEQVRPGTPRRSPGWCSRGTCRRRR